MQLVNLSSGVILTEKVLSDLFKAEVKGKAGFQKFLEDGFKRSHSRSNQMEK